MFYFVFAYSLSEQVGRWGRALFKNTIEARNQAQSGNILPDALGV
jgi:hypothetical protein